MVNQQRTNVVYAMLPCRDDFDQSMKVMRRFGDVGGVNWVKNGHGLLEVAFYDIRAAERAINELGDSQCWQAAPCGDRFVHLPGSMGLDKAVIDKIFDLRPDDSNPDSYILEFHDIRDAFEYRERAQKDWKKQVEEAALAASEKEAEEQLLPGTYAVRVSGVPNEVLSDNLVEVMLEQAGLLHDVSHYTLHRGDEVGDCILILSSDLGMQRCLYHFAGCCWGAHATLIGANPVMCSSEAEAQHLEGLDADEALFMHIENYEQGYDQNICPSFGEYSEDIWSYEEQAGASPKLPELSAAFSSHKESPTSDASTDLSESDEEREHKKGRVQHHDEESVAIST